MFWLFFVEVLRKLGKKKRKEKAGSRKTSCTAGYHSSGTFLSPIFDDHSTASILSYIITNIALNFVRFNERNNLNETRYNII